MNRKELKNKDFLPITPYKYIDTEYPDITRTKKAGNNLIHETIAYQMQYLNLPQYEPITSADDSFTFGVNSRTHTKDKFNSNTPLPPEIPQFKKIRSKSN